MMGEFRWRGGVWYAREMPGRSFEKFHFIRTLSKNNGYNSSINFNFTCAHLMQETTVSVYISTKAVSRNSHNLKRPPKNAYMFNSISLTSLYDLSTRQTLSDSSLHLVYV